MYRTLIISLILRILDTHRGRDEMSHFSLVGHEGNFNFSFSKPSLGNTESFALCLDGTATKASYYSETSEQ